MFVHTVFFKFTDFHDRTEAKSRLETMKGTVSSLRSIEVGLDRVGSSRSWDMVLITRFDDRAGYEAYAVDPAHLVVLSWLKTVVAESATVDYSQE
jgi:hypothetical protein